MKVITKHSIEKAGKLDIFIKDYKLKEVSSYKYLGVYVDISLNWSIHVDYICKRIYPKLKFFNRSSSFPSSHVLLKTYKATVLPTFDYGCIAWMNCSKKLSDKLERLQKQALRKVLQKDRKTCSQAMRNYLGILILYNRRRFLCSSWFLRF